MPTRSIDPAAPDPAIIAEAARLIRTGALVAFPTETVYGLGADALNADAVRRIFAAKGRPSFNPLIAHVADVDAARALVTAWPDAAARLAEAFWPGPVTLVLPKRSIVPDVVTAGLPAVAVRVPAHPVARDLIAAAGTPVAAPSANRFTELSPTTARHVEKALGDRVELILDGGPTSVGIESTVVDLTGPTAQLLRPGTISRARLAEVVGHELAAPPPPSGDAPRLGPGMVERHYAPRAAVWLFDAAARDRVASRLGAERPGRVGALLRAPWDASPAPDLVEPMPDDPEAYAARLYATLHAMDDAGCAVVLIERPPATAAWAGVRDRIERSAR